MHKYVDQIYYSVKIHAFLSSKYFVEFYCKKIFWTSVQDAL